MKPHITREKYGWKLWICKQPRTYTGAGYTPKSAYDHWAKKNGIKYDPQT